MGYNAGVVEVTPASPSALLAEGSFVTNAVGSHTVTITGDPSQFFATNSGFAGTPYANSFGSTANYVVCSLTVTNTLDSGTGSLRDAIICANTIVGTDTIDFNIPGAGPHTIQPASALPTITDPVLIDGYTEPGASPNTLAVGSDAALMIELDGTGAGGDGLTITAADSTMRGLVINRFSGDGISITGAAATGNVVEGNFIGTDVTGTVALANNLRGVLIQDASGNTVGGSLAEQRNVISGNIWSGIGAITAPGTVIQGNYVGTDAGGTFAIGNGSVPTSSEGGITIENFTGAIVGTDGDGVNDAAEGNLLSGNLRHGVRIGGGSGDFGSHVVAGNFIGVDATGTVAVPNQISGIDFINSRDNRVGTNSDGVSDDLEANVISGNENLGTGPGTGSGRGILLQDNSGTADGRAADNKLDRW